MPLINNIPERFEDGFSELDSLTKEQYALVKEVLEKQHNKSSINGLASVLSPIISKEFEHIDIYEILMSVGSIIPYIDTKEMIGEIVDDIVFLCDLGELTSKENTGDFRERIEFLLNNDNVYLASKSDDLLNNYGNTFITGRSITDIRPVFGLEMGTPKAAVIVHNLSIHYQSNEEPYHKDITLVLTGKDIEGLKDILVRAEEKEKCLKSILSSSNIDNLI